VRAANNTAHDAYNCNWCFSSVAVCTAALVAVVVVCACLQRTTVAQVSILADDIEENLYRGSEGNIFTGV
jgi:hypothetical protein